MVCFQIQAIVTMMNIVIFLGIKSTLNSSSLKLLNIQTRVGMKRLRVTHLGMSFCSRTTREIRKRLLQMAYRHKKVRNKFNCQYPLIYFLFQSTIIVGNFVPIQWIFWPSVRTISSKKPANILRIPSHTLSISCPQR